MGISEKGFNEVIQLVEEYINELNAATVNRAFDKRVDQFNKADDEEREEFNKILQIEDRDKRAKAYKEFDKKANDRFGKETKKIDRYYNYALRHPEVLEAIEKYVDNDGNTHELEFSVNKNKYKFDHKINGKSVVSATDSEPNANYERKHAVKNYGLKKVEEALSLMEEIINEVSLKKWKEAAYNSVDKRREDASKAADIAAQSWDDYEEGSRKHPEEEDALYKRAWHADRMDKKASDRADHALDVLGIKAKGKSANKTIKAAKNSEIKRNDAYLQNTDPEKFDKLRNRMEKTDRLVMADPVKSRNESLIEEADHHANSKNPVVKITDKNYQVASGKSLPGPFNKNHVGQYIVYNKDTDASYLVTPDNWKKSKIKRDLERQGKFYEALEEAISALLEYTEADKKKAAKKVLDDRKREYLSKYANVLDAANIDGSENVPDGDMKDLERAEKRYEHAKKVANEAFEETLKILELFDRPDLLNDIDTTLGSPVKKTFKKAIGSIVAPKKEKKVKECKK